MRYRSALVLGPLLVTMSLAACATPAAGGGIATPDAAGEPPATTEPSATPDGEVVVARAQAQTWLDAVDLPPGAVRSDVSIGGLSSYTGWPCGPIEEIEAFWTVPGSTVHDTVGWLREHPPADLVSTAVGSTFDDPAIEYAIVGYIPAPGAQEGIVYTITKRGDDVAVRAEIAALTASGGCPPLPDGGQYGAPGQG